MKTYISLFCSFAIINFISAQTIHYVRSGGTGDGSSWQNASGNLQEVLISANQNDEIWVAAGVYKPETQMQDPTNFTNPVSRTSSFTMPAKVKLYGGFPASGNPTMNNRDYVANETILSGDIGVIGDSSDNCFHVLFFANISLVTIDGFTIKDGIANANGSNGSATSYIPSLGTDIKNYYGGAAYIYQSDSITIANCKFIDNMAGYEGGALYINGGNHAFNNNIFENNKGGGFGGAIHSLGGTHVYHQNNFHNNRVILQSGGAFPMPTPNYYASGGAISSSNGSHTFTQNTFTQNKATVPNSTTNSQGGALYLSNGDHTISNNIFNGNQSLYLPTGVQVSNGGAIFTSNATTVIEKNEFINNSTHGSAGAVHLSYGNHLMQANLFKNNSAIGMGGAVSCNSTTLRAVNNIFYQNSSQNNAGAIHSSYTGGTNYFTNNTFYANTASQSGGALYFDNRQDHVLNNIFWNNTANSSSSASGADFTFYNSNGSTFLNNIYQTGSDPIDPLFNDAANGDFSLTDNSPCINAGDNAHYIASYSPFDYAGNQRIENDTIDIGAVEFKINLPTSINTGFTKTPFTIFPNPTANQLNIITDIDNSLQHLTLTDLSGKIILSAPADRTHHTLSIEHLPAGMYTLYMHSVKNSAYKVVVKQ